MSRIRRRWCYLTSIIGVANTNKVTFRLQIKCLYANYVDVFFEISVETPLPCWRYCFYWSMIYDVPIDNGEWWSDFQRCENVFKFSFFYCCYNSVLFTHDCRVLLSTCKQYTDVVTLIKWSSIGFSYASRRVYFYLIVSVLSLLLLLILLPLC